MRSRAGVVVFGLLIGGCHSDGGETSTTDTDIDTDADTDTVRVIGEWVDAPGACPADVPQRDVTTVSELNDATRGEGSYASDAPGTCYLVHNGTYIEGGPILMYLTASGSPTQDRLFVGESRSGVILKGRAGFLETSSHIALENLTFDITGYPKSGSWNTITVFGDHITLRNLTLTGDCSTGSTGGHIEIDLATDVLIENNLVENFGHCGPDGHLDHGIYLAAGERFTVRNNVIRGNASRGILFNTQQGDYGTMSDVVIENNRIYDNGHADYEDGIAMNAEATGTITNVEIRHNLIYGNYYSGLRFVGDVMSNVTVEHNTFWHNGDGSTSGGRSEVNLDDVGSGNDTLVSSNVFVAGNNTLNDCYDAGPRGFLVDDNVVSGASPSLGCVTNSVALDPGLVDPATGDFHATNASAAAYGAYAP